MHARFEQLHCNVGVRGHRDVYVDHVGREREQRLAIGHRLRAVDAISPAPERLFGTIARAGLEWKAV